jgi:alpha-beta hydrolase superfamily lysophospholipase
LAGVFQLLATSPTDLLAFLPSRTAFTKSRLNSAWLHKNAAQYGVDLNNIFVAGHSAGGHLVALLALDPQYLQAEGVSPKSIKGVVAISGIYDLADFYEPGVVPTAWNAASVKSPGCNQRERLSRPRQLGA